MPDREEKEKRKKTKERRKDSTRPTAPSLIPSM